MAVALVQKGWEFDLMRVVTFLVTFGCGIAIGYSFMLILTTLSVWLVRNQSLMEMWWLFSSLALSQGDLSREVGRAPGSLLHLRRANSCRFQRTGQRDGASARPGNDRLDHHIGDCVVVP